MTAAQPQDWSMHPLAQLPSAQVATWCPRLAPHILRLSHCLAKNTHQLGLILARVGHHFPAAPLGQDDVCAFNLHL
eukprot:1152973-Pelagomonas_calceolata.AAC.5